MSKNVNSPVPSHGPPRTRKTAQLSQPLNGVKFADSPPTILHEAMRYFSLYLPKAFRVTEGFYSPRGFESERLAEGDIFIAFLHKQEVTLKVESSPGNDPVTVSGTSFTEFALTPPNEDVNETVIGSWEGLYSSVTKFLEATKRNRWGMPAALKVLNDAVDHNKQQVLAQTLLFNIREISRRVGLMQKVKSGIEGVDCSGTVHQFLEDEDPLFFSTRLYDVKCIPLYFTEVVQFPQPARVYRHSNTEEGEEEDSLQNLSTITIAEVTRGNRLVVRKLHSRDQLGPNFTVPLNVNLKVVAIRLQQGHLLDRICDQRCMKKSRSCPNLARIVSQGDIYMNAHFEDYCEVARGDVQAGRKRDHDMEVCYSVDTLKLKQHLRCGNVAGAVNIPGTSDRLHVMTTDSDSDAESDREYNKEDSLLTGAHQERKVLLSCPGSLSILQGLSLSWKKRKLSARDEASLGYSPHTQARKEDSHFLPCPQNTGTYEDENYEEMEEDAFTQQKTVKSDHKLPQPQPSRPSPPVSTACPHHFTKPKPKGVPSTAILLVPAVSTRTRHPPPVSKKPIMLTSRPKEPELRFHVAARLGLDWRKVCTYLGLQHHQLDQAEEAHTKLEEKAMEALVMWLQGQGESRAPRSWSTLLRALHQAGHSDMASRVEKCIGDGTLQLS